MCWKSDHEITSLSFQCRLGTAGINLTATLPLLSAYLLAASSNYSHTRPCMADLLARMLHINTTVIVFPASLEVSRSACM